MPAIGSDCHSVVGPSASLPLHPEVASIIFGHLDGRSLCDAAGACHAFRESSSYVKSIHCIIQIDIREQYFQSGTVTFMYASKRCTGFILYKAYTHKALVRSASLQQ